MLCNDCKTQQAVESEGVPFTFVLMGTSYGNLCASCARERMNQFEVFMQQDLEGSSHGLSAAQRDAVVRQYLTLSGLPQWQALLGTE
jgi:hypothetical protein